MVRLLGTLGRLDVVGAHALGDRVGRYGRENDYATFAMLLDRWLTRLVLKAASGGLLSDIVPGERAIGADLQQRAPLDKWMEVWEKVSRRSEERRVGKGWVRTGRSGWWRDPYKN